MARNYGSTAQRGYGSAHQQLRSRLLAAWRPGAPCARCGKPMWDRRRIDLGHDHVNGGYTGLEHTSCNRGEGARRGNSTFRRRIVAAKGSDTRCGTCGRPYHYAARVCGVCGAHYHPNRNDQRTCSRTCGAEYRRRTYGLTGSNKPAKTCACGTLIRSSAARCAACRRRAAEEAEQQRAAAALAAVRPCGECGQPTRQRAYCTPACAAAAKRRNDRQRRLADPGYAARLLEAKRRYRARQRGTGNPE